MKNDDILLIASLQAAQTLISARGLIASLEIAQERLGSDAPRSDDISTLLNGEDPITGDRKRALLVGQALAMAQRIEKQADRISEKIKAARPDPLDKEGP